VSSPTRVDRLILATYPRSFRREYGEEVLRTLADRRTHGGRPSGQVTRQFVVDAVRTAPRMRVEVLVNDHRALALTLPLAVAVVAALVGSPLLLLLLLAVVGAAAVLLRRGERPLVTDPGTTGRWYRWLGAGAAAFAVGAIVLVVDGPELSSPGWATWMGSWSLGLVLVLFSLVLLSSRLLHRPT